MELQKSYYAIIPANVRYDKNLQPNAKLLYGEITALCNEHGYCWATNTYFSELYDVSKETISRWIAVLAKKGYISIEIQLGENKEVLRRFIKISHPPIGENVNTPLQNNQYPIDEKINTPIDENVKDNNTVYNNTANNTNNNIYKVQVGEIIDYLNLKTKSAYRKTNKTSNSHIIARLKDGFTVDDFKIVIDKKVAEWGDDSKMAQYLRPQTLFGTKFEAYLNAPLRCHRTQISSPNSALEQYNRTLSLFDEE